MILLEKNEIKAMIELHIEQKCSFKINLSIPIGIVEAIAGMCDIKNWHYR